ncbi:MAG TPA: VOC family protein [Blastocatellia bacterium]|nr:VOC family protein [Blastocatellia bacterium]
MPTKILFSGFLLLSLIGWQTATPKRPKLLGVAHMALGVSDVEKSRVFYKDFLGFGEPYDLKNADGSLSLTFIKVNDQQYIELFPGYKPGEDRLRHISFYTDDAEQLRQYLKAKGVTVPDKANKVRIGNTSFNVKDPEGHTVEFTQYEPTGWTVREQGKFIGKQRISARIMHLGIIVGDVPAAMKFYHDTLGFNEFWRGNARGTDTVSWINMRLPDSPDYIEFMLYATLPALDARTSQHHICLEVTDINKALAQLEASPARKSYTRPLEIRTGVNQRRQLNLFDPDGTRIELMEPGTVDGNPPPSSTSPLPVVKKAS